MALIVGHTLAGLTIRKFTADKKTKINLFLATILSLLPDFDYFFGLFLAGGNMLAFHRSPLTHSPFFALFVGFCFWLFGKLQGKPYQTSYLASVVLIVLSHLVLDYLLPFMPYSFNVQAGTNGFLDFIFAHVISSEGFYNNFIDLTFYGTIYVLVVKFIWKKKLL